MIDELRATAGARTDILHESVGTWVGYFRAPETEILCAALLDAIPEAGGWVPLGEERRAGPNHGAGWAMR